MFHETERCFCVNKLNIDKCTNFLENLEYIEHVVIFYVHLSGERDSCFVYLIGSNGRPILKRYQVTGKKILGSGFSVLFRDSMLLKCWRLFCWSFQFNRY